MPRLTFKRVRLTIGFVILGVWGRREAKNRGQEDHTASHDTSAHGLTHPWGHKLRGGLDVAEQHFPLHLLLREGFGPGLLGGGGMVRSHGLVVLDGVATKEARP